MRKLFFILSLLVYGWTPSSAQEDTKLEAENAVYSSCELVEDGKYSGGKALDLKEDNARIAFTYKAAEAGKYAIYIGQDGPYDPKQFYLDVNGSKTIVQGTDKQEEVAAGDFILNEGDNAIILSAYWTWFRIDYIRIAPASSSEIVFDIASAPVDKQATEAAQKVYTFLYDNFGKKTISGIMTGDMTTAKGDVTQQEDVKAVYEASGKYPALVGFDFMNATGKDESSSWSKEYTDASIELAKDLFKRGGIPAFTWHWRDPSRVTGAFYANDQDQTPCTFKISNAMNADGTWNTSSENYQNIVKDIDTVADYFLALQKEGVACIFRPLHEASGGWFWWGTDGAENYVKLYRLIADEMINKKGVHNVIWVWNPCNVNDADWNPGETIYNVIAIDIYNDPFDYSSNYTAFDKLKTLSGGKKIIALSENGPIPDIDNEFAEEAVWSWWMPWYQSWNGKFVDKTSSDEWKKCMNDSRVVTLEDLAAGWGTYTAISTAKKDKTVSRGLFDLQGRRLSKAPTKGIYINDGKKIIVK